ncbi:MAG TPA: nucleotidyltransferase family protein [Anaerolineales bacterium]
MDAIVIAGGIPQPGEPLYEFTQGKNKALLDICGKPMIQWVLDALCAATTIDRVVVIGLPDGSGVTCPKVVAWIPNQGGLLENIRTGLDKTLEVNPQAVHILSVSSDIPAITPEMVDWVVNTAMQTDDDAYYNVISRQVMEAHYPNSRRSYVRLKDMEVCGGDMNVLRARLGTENDATWKKIIAARKSALKQAALIGYDTAIMLFLHLITLDQAVKMVSRRLHLSGRAVVCPHAEIGMDVDKPFQLEIIRADLSRRGAA